LVQNPLLLTGIIENVLTGTVENEREVIGRNWKL